MSPLPDVATEVHPLLEVLESRRAGFLRALGALPAEELERRPAPDAWSPLQIAEHLVRVEEATLAAAEGQVRAGDQRRELGTADEAAIEGLIQALRSPARFRVPEGARRTLPEGGLSLPDVHARWGALAQRWRLLVEAFPPELNNVALLRHPLAGPLCLRHTLRFLEAHLAHHGHQLTRTVRQAEPG